MSRAGDHLHGIAGPDSICLATPAETRGENFRTTAGFSVGPGDQVPFVLSWHPQFAEGSCGGDAMQAIAATEAGGGSGAGAAPTRARGATRWCAR